MERPCSGEGRDRLSVFSVEKSLSLHVFLYRIPSQNKIIFPSSPSCSCHLLRFFLIRLLARSVIEGVFVRCCGVS